MMNLLCLLCSLCIQFCTITYPVDYTPVNQHFSVEIWTVWENLVESGYNVDIEKLILINRSNSLTPSGSAPYAVFYPAEPFNQQQSSIIVTTQADTYIQVSSTNYYRWLLKSDFSINGSPSVNNIGKVGFYDIENNSYTNSSGNIMYNNYYVMPLNGDTNSPTFTWSSEGGGLPGFGGLGSLSGIGHSSGGSPLDELGNFSWSSDSSTFYSSGHSTGVNPSSATYDFTNAQQNLLGQIVDNTNKLLFNGHSLGEKLQTINANIISGTSAIFNAISVFNDNFVVNYVYDEERVDEAIQTSNMLLFVQTGNDFIYSMTDLITDFSQDISQQEQIDELVIPIDLRPYNIVYFDTDGYILSRYQPFPEVYQMRFEFLDETKAIWQPLLIAILYFSLTMSIYFDLPNIIRGAVS